jgi:hypothetical protein
MCMLRIVKVDVLIFYSCIVKSFMLCHGATSIWGTYDSFYKIMFAEQLEEVRNRKWKSTRKFHHMNTYIYNASITQHRGTFLLSTIQFVWAFRDMLKNDV